ncbi:uncharacterized protein LOC136016980 [Lathamus discolor]|uniref:uncharacterized protein LOC136016980 n=1 Tax=Lathamus discolor TaxID=678569 RepID=UPI0032B75B96
MHPSALLEALPAPTALCSPSRSCSREAFGECREGPRRRLSPLGRRAEERAGRGVCLRSALPGPSSSLPPLLFRRAGAPLLAAAASGRSPLSAQPQEPQQHERGVGSEPKPAVLPDSEERDFVEPPRLLLLLQLLLQAHQELLLLLLLRLIPPQVDPRDEVWRLVTPEHVLQDAQHGQDAGDAQSHGLQEEGEKGCEKSPPQGLSFLEGASPHSAEMSSLWNSSSANIV